jgi:hypothetical protein
MNERTPLPRPCLTMDQNGVAGVFDSAQRRWSKSAVAHFLRPRDPLAPRSRPSHAAGADFFRARDDLLASGAVPAGSRLALSFTDFLASDNAFSSGRV